MNATLVRRAPLLTALALLAVLALAACSDADTLGDAPPTEVAVGSPPRWDNGVGALLQLKCGVCHQVPAGPLSPRNVPAGLDLNYHQASPSGVPGATAAIPGLLSGILRGSVGSTPRMPLEYATPLLPAEIQALESWAAAGGP